LPTDTVQPGPRPAEAGLVVGHWPHLRAADSTARIMWSVAASLVPAAVFAGYVFGWRAWLHIGLATATAVVVEAVITRLRLGRTTVADGSAVVTGILVAFCLPPHARWFVPVVASAVAIGIAKQAFGGLGCNIWNPALVGRAFVHVSFPTDMNPATYPVLRSGHFVADIGTALGGVPEGVDAVTSPSPMTALKHLLQQAPATPQALDLLKAGHGPSLGDLALGTVGGAIGETSAVLLVLGAAYLIYKGWVRWQVPAAYLGVVALGALLLPLHLPGAEGGEPVWRPILMAAPRAAPRLVLWHLLGGGLVLGAFYMATDMVTSPITNKGLWIFGAGCGLLTMLIRLYGGYPEAVCYSILLMNTAVPLIDRWTQPRIFGHRKR